MPHFTKSENGTVTQVLIGDQAAADSGIWGTGWEKSQYGHNLIANQVQGNKFPLNIVLDRDANVMVATKPNFASWTINQETGLWEAPTPYPADGRPFGQTIYEWDESTKSWV
jgi:hypothetical protein